VVENIFIYLVGKYTNKKDTGQYLIIGIFTFECIITHYIYRFRSCYSFFLKIKSAPPLQRQQVMRIWVCRIVVTPISVAVLTSGRRFRTSVCPSVGSWCTGGTSGCYGCRWRRPDG